MEEIKPYKDEGDIRIFDETTSEQELVWHRDEEDRLITPIGENDWMFQFDNELPIPINKTIIIVRGVYHRILKGTNSLKIRIKKF